MKSTENKLADLFVVHYGHVILIERNIFNK